MQLGWKSTIAFNMKSIDVKSRFVVLQVDVIYGLGEISYNVESFSNFFFCIASKSSFDLDGAKINVEISGNYYIEFEKFYQILCIIFLSITNSRFNDMYATVCLSVRLWVRAYKCTNVCLSGLKFHFQTKEIRIPKCGKFGAHIGGDLYVCFQIDAPIKKRTEHN